jgi:hypothetical protein
VSIDVIEQVALVSGRIVHRGTGRAIDGSVTIEAAEGPVILKLLEDGTFALSADPHAFLPQIAANIVPLTLTIRAQSPEFATGVVTEEVPVTAVPPFPAQQLTWKFPLDPAAAAANLALAIRGSVIDTGDPPVVIAGAGVEVLHTGAAIAPAVTGVDGRFSFDGVVIEMPARIRVTAAGFTVQTRELWIDFSRGMHEEHFRLVMEP